MAQAFSGCAIDLSSLLSERVERWRWPRRRGRLPGRGRIRELARDPLDAIRRSSPHRLRRIGRLGDHERLIGLLMTRDEDDVLDDSLALATQWFDRILVLDGTTDPDARARTSAVLASHPEVIFVTHDEEIIGDGTVTDGARQHLLAEARRRYGTDNWIGILHGDEYIDQDPRPMLAARHPAVDPSIRVRLVHTFLHVDDEVAWPELAPKPVRQRVRHLMWPGVPETRFFFDAGDRDYDIDRHHKVMPRTLRPGPLIDGFVITQYNERTPEQVTARARQRATDGWQRDHYARFLTDPPEVFTTSLDRSGSRFAPEFAGDPEGPFAVRVLEDVVHGPDHTIPTPGIVSDTQTGDRNGAGDRTPVDLAYVVGPGGLLDLLEIPRRTAVRQWSRRMRNLRPGQFGHAACGGGNEPLGYRALVRHTETILASSRTTPEQRRIVAREMIRRLHDPGAGPSGWRTSVPPSRAAGLGALLAP